MDSSNFLKCLSGRKMAFGNAKLSKQTKALLNEAFAKAYLAGEA